MKRKTVYRLKLNRVTNTYRAEAARGYVDSYTHGDHSFNVCYMPYGQGWMSAVGGVMCVSATTLRGCVDRTSGAIADMVTRGKLPQLLAVQMVLDDVLQNGCTMPCRKYGELYKQYLEIAEGMINA